MTRFLITNAITNPTWRHPTVDYERGLGDATRGLPERSCQSADYRTGYAEGKGWKKNADPHRFRSKP